MLVRRIIPCLDIKAGRVVKGVRFVDLADAGDPVELARIYEARGADELVFLDITATIEGRRAMRDVVRLPLLPASEGARHAVSAALKEWAKKGME